MATNKQLAEMLERATEADLDACSEAIARHVGTYREGEPYPDYARSIDAVKTLIPRGYDGIIALTNGTYASLWLGPRGKSTTVKRAATPALKLAIACFRVKT